MMSVIYVSDEGRRREWSTAGNQTLEKEGGRRQYSDFGGEEDESYPPWLLQMRG